MAHAESASLAAGLAGGRGGGRSVVAGQRGRGLEAGLTLAGGLMVAGGASAWGVAGLGESRVIAALGAAALVCAGMAWLMGHLGRARLGGWCVPGLVLWVGVGLLGMAWWGVRVERAAPDRLDMLLGNGASVPGAMRGVPVKLRLVLCERPRVEAEPAGFTGRAVWARPLASARAWVIGLRASSGASGEVYVPAGGVITVLLPTDGRGAGGWPLVAGTAVELVGEYRAPSAAAGPEARDARALLAQAGRVGSVRVESAGGVEVAEGAAWLSVWGRASALLASGLERVRAGAGELLERVVPAAGGGGADGGVNGAGRAMLRAMLLGERDAELGGAYAALAPTGLVHVLSISGFHLALVAWVVVMVVRLSGDRGAWEWAIAAGAVGVYLVIVPGEAPVLRSGLMVLALLAGEALGRRHDRLSTLGLAGFALLLWRPADVLTPGFQLSFVTTGVLLWRGAWATRGLMGLLGGAGLLGLPGVRGRGLGRWSRSAGWSARGGRWRGLAVEVVERVFAWTVGLVACTALASVSSAALVMAHAGMAPGWGVLAGVVLSPIAGAALVAGVMAVLVGLVGAGLGGVLGGVLGSIGTLAAWLGSGGTWLCERVLVWAGAVAEVGGSSFVAGAVPVWWGLVVTVLVLVAIGSLERCAGLARAGDGRPRRRGLIAVLAMVLVGGLAVWLVLSQRGASELGPAVTLRAQGLALAGSRAAVVRVAGEGNGGEVNTSVQLVVDPGSSVLSAEGRVARWVDVALGPGPVTLVVTGGSARQLGHLDEVVRRAGRGRVVRAWIAPDVIELAGQRPGGEQARALAVLARAGVEVGELSDQGPTRVGPLELLVGRSGPVRVRLVGAEGEAVGSWLELAGPEDERRAWRAELMEDGSVRRWVWTGAGWGR